MSLDRIVWPGVEHTRVFFGAGARPVAAAALEEESRRWYGNAAPAGAVALILTNDRASVTCLLGAMRAGVTVVSLPVPVRGADLREYASFVREACTSQGADELVASDDLCAQLAGLGFPLRRHTALTAGESVLPLAAPGDGFRLVQFSSGSTGRPKAVALDDVALGANVQAILELVEPRPGDAMVSWLPLSHDMGLVGMFLASLVAMGPGGANGGDLVLLDPAQFMRSPSTWLRTMTEHRCSITATPDFGLRWACRRPPPGDGLDLSSLRCLIVGGEPVRAGTLKGFEAAYGRAGLSSEALCPAYGMAEVALAVTMTPPTVPWRDRTVATAALAAGRADGPKEGDASTVLVSSGPPLRGYELVARPIDGSSGHGRLGPLHVRGPSIGVDGHGGAHLAGRDGWLATGDEGMVDADGWAYITGRHDDHIVAHGRNLYAPAIEAEAGAVDGVRAGRVAAVGLPGGDWWVIAEVPRAALRTTAADRLVSDLRRAIVGVTSAQPDRVVLVPGGSLPLTPSGKLRRHRLRSDILAGLLGGVTE